MRMGTKIMMVKATVISHRTDGLDPFYGRLVVPHGSLDASVSLKCTVAVQQLGGHMREPSRVSRDLFGRHLRDFIGAQIHDWLVAHVLDVPRQWLPSSTLALTTLAILGRDGELQWLSIWSLRIERRAGAVGGGNRSGRITERVRIGRITVSKLSSAIA